MNQTGNNASASFGTYNDVGGSQHNVSNQYYVYLTPASESEKPLQDPFADDKFIKSGTYTIENEKYGSILFGDSDERIVKGSHSEAGWNVTLFRDKQWTIQKSDGLFACSAYGEDDDDSEINLDQMDQYWIISRVGKQLYRIHPRGNDDLVWALLSSEDGYTAKLVSQSKRPDAGMTWKFKETEQTKEDQKIPTSEATSVKPRSVTRPTVHSAPEGNTITITIPPKWHVAISALRLGNTVNLIRIKHIENEVLDTQNLASTRDEKNPVLTLEGLRDQTLNYPADPAPAVLILEFFHSKSKFTRAQVYELDKEELSRFPAQQSRVSLAILSFNKQEIDINTLSRPQPGSVNAGYNETLDKPRPKDLEDYMTLYDILIVVDDSSSMKGRRWDEVREALVALVDKAKQFYADGIEICFLNSPLHESSIASKNDLLRIYDRVYPTGNTPIGATLQRVLDRQMDKLDEAIGHDAYSRIKPLDIIVITDGVPTDDPAPVIQSAARELDEKKHHPNIIGIQFLQIGDEEGAKETLESLARGPVRNMVDTVSCAKHFAPEHLKRILLGGIHPSIRAQMC
ncbi:hypothetical protein CPB86DRAFT_796488 [Serendipita vermifera]|nr:hypothetical protein CPB86DRAFT_796488 [Serendipita vermifera]